MAEVAEVEALHHHHCRLCWVSRGQEEVGNPWSAVDQMVAGEEEGSVWPWVRCERVSKMAVARTVTPENALEAEVVGDRLCLMEEAGEASLHGMKVVERVGPLAVAGLG